MNESWININRLRVGVLLEEFRNFGIDTDKYLLHVEGDKTISLHIDIRALVCKTFIDRLLE